MGMFIIECDIPEVGIFQREYAERSGFPAKVATMVKHFTDPTTAPA